MLLDLITKLIQKEVAVLRQRAPFLLSMLKRDHLFLQVRIHHQVVILSSAFYFIQVNGSTVSYQSERYQLKPDRPKGLALIFHHIPDVDDFDLKGFCESLDFTPRHIRNPSLAQVKAVIDTTVNDFNANPEEYQSLLVCVRAYGTKTELYANDHTSYSIQMLTDSFLGSHCPGIVGKPKLFFIQVKRTGN